MLTAVCNSVIVNKYHHQFTPKFRTWIQHGVWNNTWQHHRFLPATHAGLYWIPGRKPDHIWRTAIYANPLSCLA